MRGLGNDNHSRDLSPLSYDEEDHLAKVEHNRWNVEKLLMGYRRPRKEEDCFEVTDKEQAKILAKNKKLFVHHDVRPFDKLNDVKELDREFARYIPWIIKMTDND